MSQDHTLGSENYRVVFLGVTDGSGTDIQAFSQKLSKQFQIPMEKALRIAKSAPLVIKKNVSRSKAERYRQVFGTLGGQVRIEQTDGGIKDHAPSTATGRVDGFETTAIDSKRPVGGSSDPAAQITGVESDRAIGEAYDDAIAGAYEDSFTPPTHGPSKVLEAQGFQCPSCGLEQPKGTECIKCGIVFQKYEQMADAALHASAETGEDPTRFEPMPRDMEVNIEHAGFWIRAGAYIVDSVVLFVISFALGILLFMTLRPDRNPTALASLNPLFNLISLFLPFAYFIYYLGKRGYTPGKGFLGLQVIRTDGSGLTYGDAAIRSFSYILSSIPLYLGFLWIAFDKGKQGWHDKIAKTQVIRAEDVPAWRKWIALLPVILIPLIGIVAALSLPVYLKYTSRADVVKAVSDLQTVKSHLEEHYYRYESYPLTGEFRTFLRRSIGRIPRDPFNNGAPYRYQSDGFTFTLWSIGPDREDDYATIAIDPLRSRSFLQKGDIIFTSDADIDESFELFGKTPDGIEPGGEIFTITPSPL